MESGGRGGGKGGRVDALFDSGCEISILRGMQVVGRTERGGDVGGQWGRNKCKAGAQIIQY